MFKKIGISALMLFSSLAVAQPQLAQAADRDGFRREEPRQQVYRREDARRDTFRRELVERRYHHDRFHGYYDRAGCWHEYR